MVEQVILFVADEIFEDDELEPVMLFVGDALILVADVLDEAFGKVVIPEPLEDRRVVDGGEDHLFFVVVQNDLVFAVEAVGKEIHFMPPWVAVV